jgi:hypothetical protein
VPTGLDSPRARRIAAIALALGGTAAGGHAQERHWHRARLETPETLQQVDVVLEGIEDDLEDNWIHQDALYRAGSRNLAARVDEYEQRERLYDIYSAGRVTTMPDVHRQETVPSVFGGAASSAAHERQVSSSWALTGNTLLCLIVLIVLCAVQRRAAPAAARER